MKKFTLVVIMFTLLLVSSLADAETLELISNTDICEYIPEINKDFCKTEYELCDNELSINKIYFIYGDFTEKNSLPENEFKTEIEGLETEIKIEDEGDCYKVEISGYKNPLLDIDNVLCFDSNCHYEYALWNGSYNFRTAIYGNVSSLTTYTTGFISKNLTLGSSLELFKCQFIVNQTNRTLGYLYWNNYKDYICVDINETTAVSTIIDEGNSTQHGSYPDDYIISGHLNCTAFDSSIYSNHGSISGNVYCFGSKIGRGLVFDGNFDIVTYPTQPRQQVTTDWTMIGWFKFDEANPDDRFLDIGQNNLLYFFLDTGGDDTISLHNYDGSHDNIDSNVVAVEETWYHIAGTGGGGQMKLYINGIQKGSTASGSPNWGVAGGDYRITVGGIVASSKWFNGTADNIIISNKTFSADEIALDYFSTVPFFSNGSVETNGTLMNINFISQTPADITSTNIMNQLVNITYNITGENINLTTIVLETIINSSKGISSININGVSTYLNLSYPYNYNVSINFSTLLTDNNIYPASYIVDDETMEDTNHSVFVATNNIRLIQTKLLNVSNSTRFSFFEIMVNSSATVCELIYCNSSYSSGSVTTSQYCSGFGTVQPNTPFNHCHGSNRYSCHLYEPLGINVTTGKIGNVQVTPKSYFIVKGSGCNTHYISNDTSTAKTTINNGVSWSNQPWSIDTHLHQFNNDTFYYRQCVSDTFNNKFCGSYKSDNLEITPFPPSSPNIIIPITGSSVKGIINITYQECISPISNLITFYNISLLYSNLTFNITIVNNNSVLLYYEWDTREHADGNYIIRVYCEDNQSLNNTAFTGVFTIFNAIIHILQVETTYCYNDNQLFVRERNVAENGSIVFSDYLIECSNGCYDDITMNGGACALPEIYNISIAFILIISFIFLIYKLPRALKKGR